MKKGNVIITVDMFCWYIYAGGKWRNGAGLGFEGGPFFTLIITNFFFVAEMKISLTYRLSQVPADKCCVPEIVVIKSKPHSIAFLLQTNKP